MTRNIIANFIGRFWSILSNFLFIPLYIHYLGFDSYSIISFTLVIAGLMAMLDAGLTATLSREFARYDNSGQEKLRIFKTLESSFLIIIGLSMILVIALSGMIAGRWLNLTGFEPERVTLFIRIISFDVGFQLLLRFYLGGLMGMEQQVKANFYQIGWGMLRNGLVIVAIIFVPTLEMFFIWQAVSTIIFALLLRLSLWNSLTGNYEFAFHPVIEVSVFRRIWRFAGGMLLISLVASLNTQLDKLAISKTQMIENLGYYTLAVSLAMGLIVLINPIATALLPRFTALFTAGKNDEASNLFYKISLFVSIIVFSFMANLAFFANDLVWIWTNKTDLADQAAPLIPVLAFAYAMLSLQILPYNIAIANGHTKLNNLLGLISLLITIPGYWLATRTYGAMGAASVFCAVQAITTVVYIYLINRWFISQSVKKVRYFAGLTMPLLISLAVALVFSYNPPWAGHGRFLTLAWIGMATSVTLIANTLILFPIRELKQLIRTRSLTKTA